MSQKFLEKVGDAVIRTVQKHPLVFQALFSPGLMDDIEPRREIREHKCEYRMVDTLFGREQSTFCWICQKEDTTDKTPWMTNH